MRPLFSALLCTLCLAMQAQTFDQLIEKADSLYDAAAYKESALTYDQALRMEDGISSIYYNAACSWALTGDTIHSIAYLFNATEKGWRNLSHIKRDKDLTNIRTLSNWPEVLDKVQANIDEYEKDFDKPLKNQLEAIYVKDQTLRMLYRDAEDKFGRESEEMKYFWNLVNTQDSLNELEVVEILEKRGWVGKSVIGDKANMTLWLVIQHAPLETQEKYLPLLRESVKAGESKGSRLALLEDRILMRNEKPQIYGSQIKRDSLQGELYVYPVKDPEYVNQRRAAIGLGPIEEYVARWELEWNIPQKEK